MQLSVFLTPIFAKQISVGFGVCEELAVFSQFNAPAMHTSSRHLASHATHRNDAMSAMSMAEMPHKIEMQHSHSAHLSSDSSNHSSQHTLRETTSSTVSASKVLTPNLLQPQAEPHHQNHAKCEFCLLLGHSVLPPLHVVITVLLTTAISTLTAKAKAADAVFLNQNKNIRPQGRAPPLFIS